MASRGRVSMFCTTTVTTVTIVTTVALSACGSRVHHIEVEHANQPPPSAAEHPPDPTTEPQPDPAPGTPEQDFILSDEPRVDSVELLEATKHDCCEQASPAEVKAGIRDQPSEPATRRH